MTTNWASRATLTVDLPPYKGRCFSVWFLWWDTVCISTGCAVEPVIHHGSGRLWSRVALHRSRRGDVHPWLCRLHRSSERKHLPAQICEFSCCATHLCLCVSVFPADVWLGFLFLNRFKVYSIPHGNKDGINKSLDWGKSTTKSKQIFFWHWAPHVWYIQLENWRSLWKRGKSLCINH